MSITLNIHQTKSIIVREGHGKNAQWLSISLMANNGSIQGITIFDVTLRDLQNAIMDAMFVEEDHEENE